MIRSYLLKMECGVRQYEGFVFYSITNFLVLIIANNHTDIPHCDISCKHVIIFCVFGFFSFLSTCIYGVVFLILQNNKSDKKTHIFIYFNFGSIVCFGVYCDIHFLRTSTHFC